MNLIFDYLKENVKTLAVFAVIYCTFTCIFMLSDLPLSVLLYSMTVSGFFLFVMSAVDFLNYRKKRKIIKSLYDSILITVDNLPSPSGKLEEEYQALISLLYSSIADLKHSMNLKVMNMNDYYTMWVHQIKTPISAMKLIIQNNGDGSSSDLSIQLFKIEQYVEMVLAYIRMDSDSTDYILKEFDLLKTVKSAVRKHAQLFIRKKIPIDIRSIDATVISDEKWIEFVIGQILSNAVKYSDKGKVSVYLKEGKILVIEDSGVGIAQSDLPRVFEKGFTGYNGRTDKSATGIGLYLSKQILTKLGHSIEITSQIGKGTKVMINLSRNRLTIE